MSPLLEIVIPGDPVPKGRPRVARGRAYTPERTRDAETAFAWHVLAERVTPTNLPVSVRLAFYTRTRRRVDLDNLVKLATDSVTGLVWLDDSQIVRLEASKAHDPANPRTVIRVDVWQEAAVA